MDKNFYLDERIVLSFNAELLNTGMYTYTVYDRDNLNVITNILFVGNVYYNYDTSQTLNIDVTDIIRGQLTPSSVFNNFISNQPTTVLSTTQPIYKKFEVVLDAVDEDYTYYTSGEFYVNMYYRYPMIKSEMNNSLQYDPFATPSTWIALQGRYILGSYGYFKLPPHIPYISSDNYGLAFAGYTTTNTLSETFTLELNDIIDVNTENEKRINFQLVNNNYCVVSTLKTLFENTSLPITTYSTEVPRSDYSVWFGGEELAIIDICPAKYYLMWQDRAGSYQSQAFDMISTYSETFNKEYITDYSNTKRLTTINTQPKIKIQTGYISNDLYPYYESIYTSPYLLLYDTQEDKSYLVNVTGTEYVEKTFKNQGKQMFNIQLDLEFANTQKMIY